MMDRISAYRELIRKNIDYENYPPIYNKQEVDELVDLIVETLMLPEVGFQKKISAYTEYPGKRNSFWMQIHTACHRLKCRHMATVLP